MRHTIVALGEMLWDMLPTGQVLGGAPFNFAYRVSSLGDRGIIITRLGRDELGARAWDQMDVLGMDTSYVQWDEVSPTGTSRVIFKDQGEPEYYVTLEVAYDSIQLTDETLDLAAQTDCICFGTLIQRSRTSRHSLHELLEAATSSLKVLDVNLRTGCYSLDTVTSSLGWADVLRLNDHEVALLGQLLGVSTESVPRFADEMMRRWELSHCIVTLGERGVFAASAGGASVYVPGYGVEVVDLCGVGSAFTAGFIHKLLRGRPVDECCRLGNALGATVASQRGATAPIYADDLHRFMEADHDRVYEPSLRHLAAR